MHIAHRRNRPRGLANAVILMIISLLVVMVVSMGTASVQNLSHMAIEVYEKQAAYAAEAGMMDALLELKRNHGWSAGFTNKALPHHPDWLYTVRVWNNYGKSGQMVAEDGTCVAPGYVYIVSSGWASGRGVRTMSAMAGGAVIFDMAVYANNSISVTGGFDVDAYDSSQGRYSKPRNNQVNAHIGVNASARNAISIGGGSKIDGNVYVGPGGGTASVSAKSNQISGQVIAQPVRRPMPQMIAPYSGSGPSITLQNNAKIQPGVYGSLTLNGRTATLTSGVYYFRGDVNIGSGKIVANADGSEPVVIYLDGKWDTANGSLVNQTGRPRDLQIYGTDLCTSIGIRGENVGVFYARRANVNFLSQGEVYGGLIAQSITATGGAAIHYDTQLRGVVLGDFAVRFIGYNRW